MLQINIIEKNKITFLIQCVDICMYKTKYLKIRTQKIHNNNLIHGIHAYI